MPIRVELTADARDDLIGYRRNRRSGNFEAFLRKLVRLEEVGKAAGVPLGRDLGGWRKIVLGDRDWRILLVISPDDAVATVWVVANHADNECYRLAAKRLAAIGAGGKPEVASLAATLVSLLTPPRKQKDH